MNKKIALAFSLLYIVFGGAIIVSNYGCSGWVCNITSYLVSTPWSKIWDAGGPLFLSFGEFGNAVLNIIGVLVNSLIIFYTIRLIGLIIKKFKN